MDSPELSGLYVEDCNKNLTAYDLKYNKNVYSINVKSKSGVLIGKLLSAK